MELQHSPIANCVDAQNLWNKELLAHSYSGVIYQSGQKGICLGMSGFPHGFPQFYGI